MIKQLCYLDAYDRAVELRRPSPLLIFPFLRPSLRHRESAFGLFDLFQGIGITGGVLEGFTRGNGQFGVPGAVIGGVLGLGIGYVVGTIPYWLAWLVFEFQTRIASTQSLRTRLQTEQYLADRLIAEMIVRGESVESFWPYVLSLLQSGSFPERYSGWVNLNIWFPRVAKQIEGFLPNAPAKTRSKYITRIEKAEPCAAPLGP